MKTSICTLILTSLFLGPEVFAQNGKDISWYNPSEHVVQFDGQGWENLGYNRLPRKAKKTVREAVWSLSKHSAGISIRFETDADSISVRYQVDGNLAMHHMPATGVSGVDLYVKNNEEWLWCRGKFVFEDPIHYDFKVDVISSKINTHQLFLPLYNSIRTFKIGVPKGSLFKFLPERSEKPIVVYGTSIAQGACASRPGMAWTNLLSRKLDCPVVNLGFSGNGRLEPEVIALINEIDASVFVLDCLPNLSPNHEYTEIEIKKRIEKSVNSLRAKHLGVPILLVQHVGYSDGLVDKERKSVYETLNRWMVETLENLKKQGVENLYIMTKSEIGLSNDVFVDGTHPTDLGMVLYATAYSKKIKAIQIENYK
ncbi:MAG: hydrolase [Pricia sp.]|nr:hydrolase [Pricia sp.]